MTTWRYEPLDTSLFPLGEGPFRARGLAYVSALRYVDTRLPGSRAAFLAALADEQLASFYEQIFLVTGDYDVSPLVRLFAVTAGLEGVPVGQFIQHRARWSGENDAKGLWKPALRAATPGEMARRLDFAFDRYFPPCGAEVHAGQDDRFEGELRRLPGCMNGLYVQSTVGYYLGALTSIGASNVRVNFERPAPDGAHAGVALERVRFTVRWETPRT